MSFISRAPRGIKINGAAILTALALLALAIAASLIGDAAGSSVHEGGATPCMIAGVDAGGTLNTMFTAGWLSFLILPFASLVIVIGLEIEPFDVMKARRRHRSARFFSISSARIGTSAVVKRVASLFERCDHSGSV